MSKKNWLALLMAGVLALGNVAFADDKGKGKGKDDDDNGLRQQVQALQAQDVNLQNQISNIKLTPGPVGPAGAVGSQGIAGITGAKGDTGPIGPQGLQGLTGLTGAKGSTGSQGLQGLSGATGATGAVGPQGVSGVAGSAGVKGDTGIVGAAGPQGPAGTMGLQGPMGPQGADGLAGKSGNSFILRDANGKTIGDVITVNIDFAVNVLVRVPITLSNGQNKFIGMTFSRNGVSDYPTGYQLSDSLIYATPNCLGQPYMAYTNEFQGNVFSSFGRVFYNTITRVRELYVATDMTELLVVVNGSGTGFCTDITSNDKTPRRVMPAELVTDQFYKTFPAPYSLDLKN